MIVFSDKEGRVATVEIREDSRPASITFPGFDYASLQVIIEGVAIGFTPQYQISDTLGEDILLITFGESISPVNLRGTVLTGICDNQDNIKNGVRALADWWESNNLTKKQEPAQITIEDMKPMPAYIADLKLSNDNAEMSLWRFSLTLLRIPPRNREGEYFNRESI